MNEISFFIAGALLFGGLSWFFGRLSGFEKGYKVGRKDESRV